MQPTENIGAGGGARTPDPLITKQIQGSPEIEKPNKHRGSSGGGCASSAPVLGKNYHTNLHSEAEIPEAPEEHEFTGEYRDVIKGDIFYLDGYPCEASADGCRTSPCPHWILREVSQKCPHCGGEIPKAQS